MLDRLINLCVDHFVNSNKKSIIKESYCGCFLFKGREREVLQLQNFLLIAFPGFIHHIFIMTMWTENWL